MESELKSFLYLYGVGGALFVGSVALAWFRGALDFAVREDRKMLALLLGGYAVYMAYHALSQFVLPGLGGGP